MGNVVKFPKEQQRLSVKEAVLLALRITADNMDIAAEDAQPALVPMLTQCAEANRKLIKRIEEEGFGDE